ncbi:hypothetical protein C8Q80DRAFT_1122015 [Daedaleopsis nitida]|nr:hypothetical protein C8Q80DRAFT_1122015 [Daedaleopsis nitida]
MQGSRSTHTHAKRSSNALDSPLLAVILVVVVAFSLILAVSWWIIQDRKKLNKVHKRGMSALVDCESYEHSVASPITTGAGSKAVPLQEGQVEQGGKSYYELIRALQAQPNPPTPPPPARRPSQNSVEATGISKFVLRPQDMTELHGVPVYPKTKRENRVHAVRKSLGVPGVVDPRRHSFAETTASMYSSASAPIEYHELLFRQPFTLDSVAPHSAPPWISQMPRPPLPATLSDASTVPFPFEVSRPSPPASTTSEQTDTIVPAKFSPNPVSRIVASSTPSLVRSHANPNPSSALPQVRWLTNAATETPPAPALARPRRTNSMSSSSTLFSLAGAGAAPGPVVVAPLDVHQWLNNSPSQSVNLMRSRPQSPSGPRPAPSPTLAPPQPVPSIPARSPKRPPPPVSLEHMPM